MFFLIILEVKSSKLIASYNCIYTGKKGVYAIFFLYTPDLIITSQPSNSHYPYRLGIYGNLYSLFFPNLSHGNTYLLSCIIYLITHSGCLVGDYNDNIIIAIVLTVIASCVAVFEQIASLNRLKS